MGLQLCEAGAGSAPHWNKREGERVISRADLVSSTHPFCATGAGGSGGGFQPCSALLFVFSFSQCLWIQFHALFNCTLRAAFFMSHTLLHSLFTRFFIAGAVGGPIPHTYTWVATVPPAPILSKRPLCGALPFIPPCPFMSRENSTSSRLLHASLHKPCIMQFPGRSPFIIPQVTGHRTPKHLPCHTGASPAGLHPSGSSPGASLESACLWHYLACPAAC